MIKRVIRCLVFGVGLILLSTMILFFPSAQTAQAMSYIQTYPTIGLCCADSDSIVSGNEKIDLTDFQLLLNGRAKKESEYRVSGSQETTFEIPFFSNYIDVPQWNVTVNGQAVQGEVWYGDNQKYYGGSDTYLQLDSTDNTELEQLLTRNYSPVLDGTVYGTLYTVTPDADTMTVCTKLTDKNNSYVYDSTNRLSESYSPNGTQKFEYENALTKKNYQYFFIGKDTVVDFSATCAYKTEKITFKEFIDRNYNFEKEIYNEIGCPIESIYSIANRILEDKTNISYKELFYSFDEVALNIYKFIVPLSGEATIKYSSFVNVEINNEYVPTVYAVVQKQIGNYTTNYSMTINSKIPYIIHSSNSTRKSGSTYTARANKNFYFMCSSSKKPVSKNPPQLSYSRKQLTAIVICRVVGAMGLIVSIVTSILWIRDTRKHRHE